MSLEARPPQSFAEWRDPAFEISHLSRLGRLPVTRADIVSMGVGGLLKEIVSRPQRRNENKA
jgi:hypothetical protein